MLEQVVERVGTARWMLKTRVLGVDCVCCGVIELIDVQSCCQLTRGTSRKSDRQGLKEVEGCSTTYMKRGKQCQIWCAPSICVEVFQFEFLRDTESILSTGNGYFTILCHLSTP